MIFSLFVCLKDFRCNNFPNIGIMCKYVAVLYIIIVFIVIQQTRIKKYNFSIDELLPAT